MDAPLGHSLLPAASKAPPALRTNSAARDPLPRSADRFDGSLIRKSLDPALPPCSTERDPKISSWRIGFEGDLRPPRAPPAAVTTFSLEYGPGLLDFNFRAGVLQLLLGSVGVGLVDPFLDGFGCAVDQVLRLLQAKTGQLAHRLDPVDLVRTGFGQQHGAFGLFLDRRRG